MQCKQQTNGCCLKVAAEHHSVDSQPSSGMMRASASEVGQVKLTSGLTPCIQANWYTVSIVHTHVQSVIHALSDSLGLNHHFAMGCGYVCSYACMSYMPQNVTMDMPARSGCSKDGDGGNSGSELQSIGDFVQANKDVLPDQCLMDCLLTRVLGIPQEPGSKPTFGPMYRLSPAEKHAVERQVKDYLTKGFIEHLSPHMRHLSDLWPKIMALSGRVLVTGLSTTTLYRHVKNKYPLPRTGGLIDQVQGCPHFSSLDLQSGYHQIRNM